VPQLAQGHIVLADVPDLQGRNRKVRPVVIITPTDDIEAGKPTIGVAITGTLPAKLTPDHVLLPYHNGGHPRTGLRKKSVAVCSWLVKLQQDDVKEVKGTVPEKQLYNADSAHGERV
jgi:mRNA-degrading endonuclease toxin of MazEF toxin-antitoxin module